MNAYGWLLVGQTALALLALGLCGGWAILPFRREDRPHLWLAAPLAGVLVLGGSIASLYFFAGLPFRWCLWLGLAANVLATVAALARTRPSLPTPGGLAVAAVLASTAVGWATVNCNKTAISAGEPTLAALDGSDMFGYAITADWVRAHPAAERPRLDEPLEVMPHVNLYTDGGRPLAHLLTAAAGEARGTTSLFSYDWASGVLLSAALLAFGAVFATGSLMLVLLVVGAGTCSWLANARTGFFGRSIAYPGVLLIVGLLLITAREFTWRRLASLAALGFATGFSLAPVLPAVVVVMVVASYVAALALVYPFDRLRDAAASFRAEVLKPGLLAAVAGAAAVAPAFAAYYSQRDHIGTPGVPAVWSVVIPVALDLEPPARPLLKPRTEWWLLRGATALLAVTAGLAVYYRQPVTLALTCCALVVPAAWLLGQNLLHTFQGLVYPLTLAGAGLLAAARPGVAWHGAARIAVAAAVVVGIVGLRVPQARATVERYVYSEQPSRAVVRQSETHALREEVGGEAVDVALGHYADNHVILAEIAAQGIPIRFRAPGWERSLGNWARVVGCPAPDLFLPKARFTVVERNAYAPPGTERYVGSRLKLVEDREAVSVLGVEGTQEMIWDEAGRPGVWIGNTPTTFLIHNGTGRGQSVRLLGNTSAGPAHPNRDRRTLCYKLNDQAGKQSLPKEGKAAIPLQLAPGLNRVEVCVEEAADPQPPPRHPVILLSFCHWRLEPGEPAGAR